MDLSVIIVTYNVKEKLRDNLRALFASRGDFSFEVFVLDNDSADGSARMVKDEWPQVKLIANGENLGFAKANNQAIKSAVGDFILLLNPDMRVFPDTLANMLVWMRAHPRASVASCRLINDRGKIIKHVRRFPALTDQLAIVLKLPHLWPGILSNYIIADFDYAQDAPVDSVRGGFFLLRRSTIDQVGLLDERFFLWFEEVDYCRRVKNSGGEVWYTNAARCVDLVGQSFRQLPRARAQQYFRASQLKYFKKWHPAWQFRLLQISWPFGILLTKLGGTMEVKNQART